MVQIENDCVSCDIPCVDCGLKRNPHFYCDECEEEVDELYEYNGQQVCESCLLKLVPLVTI